MISATGLVAATEANKLFFIWERATPEAKVIIVVLMIFSVFAWSVRCADASMSIARTTSALRDAMAVASAVPQSCCGVRLVMPAMPPRLRRT